MTSLVYVLTLNGDNGEARKIAAKRYPDCEIITVSKKDLRECGSKRQFQRLRELKGDAFFVFTESMEDLQEPLLLKLTIMFHRCRETVIADAHGRIQIFRRWSLWSVLPEAALSIAADLFICLVSWMALHVYRLRPAARHEFKEPTALDVAFLYPFPVDRSQPGGAMSHVTGFLSGLAHCLVRCEIFSGRDFPVSPFPVHEVPHRRRRYLFREVLALSYNLPFVSKAEQYLSHNHPLFIYQRHGRYVIAGALLSRRVRRPLVLEYNGSEVWIARHWDPTRFLAWLILCEEISLSAAALITVVSDALKNELIERGIPEKKILVNPNAVDPDMFHPGCGGSEIRRQLGFTSDQVVVGFIGSFSYWHGVAVLQEAIQVLLREQETSRSSPQLRFLLVGDGPLSPEIREALEPYSKRGWVVFAGHVPHEKAPQYLDAADILASPHVPMADGRPFFGSPTKLFEYMAMGKAIVASDLDQLARVLTHMRTGWLVKPGDTGELVDAIRLLARKPEIRKQLGERAREAALAEHTWKQNAERVLGHFTEIYPATQDVACESRRPETA